ncbi:Centromere protein J [Hondaea fermentalgiana]|uniref:Centromere protein J n=1 Tax=Hondaea fermentalgiana TaxID=2315210 RepID=A0A2R5GLX0_9STRA|nr:Centromere protein J [Hondaea fermentalgiana]|eukprot:GBG31625.1 Centromere protein J [Hondaea fermentalgiana]
MEATRAVLEEVQAFRAAVEETEYAKAVEIMTRLIARDPKRAPFFASRAKANVLLGRMDEALKDSTQALQRDGKLALAHLCKGCALVGLGRHTGNAAQLKSGGRALQQARTLDKTIASQDLFKRFEAALSDQMARNFVVKGAVHQNDFGLRILDESEGPEAGGTQPAKSKLYDAPPLSSGLDEDTLLWIMCDALLVYVALDPSRRVIFALLGEGDTALSLRRGGVAALAQRLVCSCLRAAAPTQIVVLLRLRIEIAKQTIVDDATLIAEMEEALAPFFNVEALSSCEDLNLGRNWTAAPPWLVTAAHGHSEPHVDALLTRGQDTMARATASAASNGEHTTTIDGGLEDDIEAAFAYSQVIDVETGYGPWNLLAEAWEALQNSDQRERIRLISLQDLQAITQHLRGEIPGRPMDVLQVAREIYINGEAPRAPASYKLFALAHEDTDHGATAENDTFHRALTDTLEVYSRLDYGKIASSTAGHFERPLRRGASASKLDVLIKSDAGRRWQRLAAAFAETKLKMRALQASPAFAAAALSELDEIDVAEPPVQTVDALDERIIPNCALPPSLCVLADMAQGFPVFGASSSSSNAANGKASTFVSEATTKNKAKENGQVQSIPSTSESALSGQEARNVVACAQPSQGPALADELQHEVQCCKDLAQQYTARRDDVFSKGERLFNLQNILTFLEEIDAMHSKTSDLAKRHVQGRRGHSRSHDPPAQTSTKDLSAHSHFASCVNTLCETMSKVEQIPRSLLEVTMDSPMLSMRLQASLEACSKPSAPTKQVTGASVMKDHTDAEPSSGSPLAGGAGVLSAVMSLATSAGRAAREDARAEASALHEASVKEGALLAFCADFLGPLSRVSEEICVAAAVNPYEGLLATPRKGGDEKMPMEREKEGEAGEIVDASVAKQGDPGTTERWDDWRQEITSKLRETLEMHEVQTIAWKQEQFFAGRPGLELGQQEARRIAKTAGVFYPTPRMALDLGLSEREAILDLVLAAAQVLVAVRQVQVAGKEAEANASLSDARMDDEEVTTKVQVIFKDQLVLVNNTVHLDAALSQQVQQNFTCEDDLCHVRELIISAQHRLRALKRDYEASLENLGAVERALRRNVTMRFQFFTAAIAQVLVNRVDDIAHQSAVNAKHRATLLNQVEPASLALGAGGGGGTKTRKSKSKRKTRGGKSVSEQEEGTRGDAVTLAPPDSNSSEAGAVSPATAETSTKHDKKIHNRKKKKNKKKSSKSKKPEAVSQNGVDKAAVNVSQNGVDKAAVDVSQNGVDKAAVDVSQNGVDKAAVDASQNRVDKPTATALDAEVARGSSTPPASSTEEESEHALAPVQKSGVPALSNSEIAHEPIGTSEAAAGAKGNGPPVVDICRLFLQGNCPEGDACLRRHVTPVQLHDEMLAWAQGQTMASERLSGAPAVSQGESKAFGPANSDPGMGDVDEGAADVTVLNDAPASTGRDALLDLLEMAGSDDDGGQHDDYNNNDEEDPWDRDARGGHRGHGGQAKDNAHNDEEELDTTLVGESVMVALDEVNSYDDDDDHHYQNGGNRGSHENGSNRGSSENGSKQGPFPHFARQEEFRANNNDNDDEEEDAEEYAEMSWKRPVREHAPQSQLVRRMFRTLDPDDDVESEEEEEASAANKSVVPTSASANAEFTAKLQEEMDRFKETNERLQVSLKQLEVDRRHLVQERLELDKQKRQLGKESDAQVEQMRAEVRKERALLQRERVALERQKQHIEVLRETARVERKDRGQVDSLQATIARMRLAEKEKAVKHKEAMQSKRERISVLEREAEQMQSALRFAEERRLDLWGQLTQAQEKIESGEAERKQLAQALESIRASSAVSPTSQSFVSPLREPTSDGRRSRDEDYIDHNNGLEDEKTGEPLYAQQARLVEAEPSPHGPSPEAECDPSERVVHIPGQTAGPKVAVGALTHVEHNAKPSRKATSQRRQRVHPDGSRTIKFADGTVKEISPDGEQTVTFSNGDIKKKIPREGLEIYYFAASDTSQTTYADGMVVCEFPNGQVERKHPSGMQEIFYVDGAVKTVNADGSEETLFSDGTKLEISSSGQRRVLRPVEAVPSEE